MRALLIAGALLLSLVEIRAQVEVVRALGARPTAEAGELRTKSLVKTWFVYQNLPQTLPIADDFSIDRTRKRWAQAGDPGVTLDQTIYRLAVDGVSEPDMAYSNQPTFRIIVDMTDPENPVTTQEELPAIELEVWDLDARPPTSTTVTAWPAFTVIDTLQIPPPVIIPIGNPFWRQDSLLVYSVPPDPRTYIRPDLSTVPLILWEDDDVYVNGTFPLNPPTIGVATFDGLSRTGFPYNFGQYSSYGIADRLTSVPINLAFSVADSVYLSFFYQARGLSGDAFPQPQDSLVLEFYAPQEDAWIRVWRTPYPSTAQVQPFTQVMIPIKEFRYLQNGFRMRFLNYATLSGAFDHWHLDYVRLGTQRNRGDTVITDVAYLEPEASLLNVFTSVPFHRFAQSAQGYMASTVNARQRNLDDDDRLITWRMRAALEGSTPPAPGPILGTNTSGNASQVFSSTHYINHPNNNDFFYDPSLSSDEAFWRVQFITNATPDLNRYNDTITFVQELSNYYAYDDGSAEASYSLNVNNARLAYRFDLLGQDTLRAVRMYFVPSANEPPSLQPTQGNFLLTIWRNLQPEDIIRQNVSFSSPEYRLDGPNKFVEYELDQPVVVDGTIYVGWLQTSPAMMNLGFDRNRDNSNRIFFKVGANWQPTQQVGSLMIRPVFKTATDPFLGIDEAEGLPGLRLHPNPASDMLFLRSTTHLPPGTRVDVLDATGRLALSTTFQDGRPIDIARLAQGLHVVRLVDAQGRSLSTARLSIQR